MGSRGPRPKPAELRQGHRAKPASRFFFALPPCDTCGQEPPYDRAPIDEMQRRARCLTCWRKS